MTDNKSSHFSSPFDAYTLHTGNRVSLAAYANDMEQRTTSIQNDGFTYYMYILNVTATQHTCTVYVFILLLYCSILFHTSTVVLCVCVVCLGNVALVQYSGIKLMLRMLQIIICLHKTSISIREKRKIQISPHTAAKVAYMNIYICIKQLLFDYFVCLTDRLTATEQQLKIDFENVSRYMCG